MSSKEFNYEQSIARLEKIVNILENGETSLEEMMKLYEEGVKLAGQCSKALDEAELKITSLSAEGDNNE